MLLAELYYSTMNASAPSAPDVINISTAPPATACLLFTQHQAIALAKRPHVIVGTPGRVVDHLSNTKGFSLKALRHLVLDEADKLLDMDFEQEIDQILKVGVWGERGC